MDAADEREEDEEEEDKSRLCSGAMARGGSMTNLIVTAGLASPLSDVTTKISDELLLPAEPRSREEREELAGVRDAPPATSIEMEAEVLAAEAGRWKINADGSESELVCRTVELNVTIVAFQLRSTRARVRMRMV
jgi:hypothetical protein